MIDRASSGPTRAAWQDLLPGLVFLIAAATLFGIASYKASLPSYYRPFFFALSSILFVASAGFLSTFVTAWARSRPAFGKTAANRKSTKPLPQFLEPALKALHRAGDALRGIDWLGDWLAIVIAVLLSALSLFAIVKGWRSGGSPPTTADQWIIGSLLVCAFPMLVLERRFSTLRSGVPDDVRPLTYLLRLVLFGLLVVALSYVMRWLALPFSTVPARLVMVFTGLVAAEIILRCLSYLFAPLPPLARRSSHANSFIAGLLRLERPSLKAIGASLNGQFGIDLGRSWALGFMRRSIFPIFLGLIVSGWLLTGVTTLNLSQRAVYEAFGSPQAVFHSGLHVFLPWPFGKLRPVEYGVVHEIPIAFPDEDDAPAKAEKAVAETGTIEGAPPVSADRLWEASRPTEASYLVASNRNGRQSFEILNIDLRIIYRIGLSDDAAYSVTYTLAKPEDLIRAAAGRMLARYFARYSVSSVLGQNREEFIRGFQKELQVRLNSLSPSIDILGIVIETIHPPAGAAEAYQEVQASSIEAVTKVANAKGDAVRDVHQAEADAIEARDSATARAAETIADAKVGTALFAGDVQAYHQGGSAFLLERRLSILGAAITPDTHLTIVDSRVPANQMQLLQMRPPTTSPGMPGN